MVRVVSVRLIAMSGGGLAAAVRMISMAGLLRLRRAATGIRVVAVAVSLVLGSAAATGIRMVAVAIPMGAILMLTGDGSALARSSLAREARQRLVHVALLAARPVVEEQAFHFRPFGADR
jgi:hypothetical protein